MVVGKSNFSLRAATEALPMRNAFSVIFFISVGMLFDPRTLWGPSALISATIAIVLLGKPLAALLITFLLRYPPRIALSVAVALAQIDEFSFILAALGKSLGLLPDVANNTLIAAAMLSISLNPILYRLIDPLDNWLKRHPFVWRWLNAWVAKDAETGEANSSDAMEISTEMQERAVVVGYGPVGRTVVRLLRENFGGPGRRGDEPGHGSEFGICINKGGVCHVDINQSNP